MEAAVVSVSEGTVGSLLGKLGDLLAGNYNLLKEAIDDIVSLKAELESMRAFLETISEAEEEPDKQAKCWANEHKIAKEFRGLKRRVVEASERRTRYKIDDAVFKPNNTSIDIRLLALYEDTSGLVGIDGLRDELIELMVGEEDVSTQQMKVLSIIGFGGLGKTTLANQIYGKLMCKFERGAFVSVSQKPNIRNIFRRILSQVGYVAPEGTNMDIWAEDELISALRESLMDKRYFIVIDDVWDETAWNVIRCALPRNCNGSMVITTTRIDTVARACCCNQRDYVYKMKSLSQEDSRKLFFKRVYGSEDACPLYLEEVSAQILKRCGGLPLAIVTISSLLASEQTKLKEHWEHILDSLAPNFEVKPTLDGMRKILNLSYINLPHYLKTCMLYLCIYPEDYIIKKNDLVRQWVAQGFVSKARGRDPENVAEGYFNELINRSIIQPADTDHNNEVLSCRLHDMMLDLIIHKCREENFITATDDIQAMIGLPDKVRRLSLNLDGIIDGMVLETIQLSQVRALARFGTSAYAPPLLKFKHLRVLALEFSSGNRLEIIDLTGMCHLFQLRHLKIKAYCKIVLPSNIRGLEQLETLELGAYGLEVPSDVIHLRRLLHLIIPIGTKLPGGIGNMKYLCTLHGFDIGLNSMDNIRDLGDLTNLRDLRICFAELEPLDDMERRQRLDASEVVGVFEVPQWIGELHNLFDLDLAVEVLENDIGILAQLQSLSHLKLHMEGTPEAEDKLVIYGTGFPVLKYFSLSSKKISELTFEAGAMPSLQELNIRLDSQYGAQPMGIEHLLILKEIRVQLDEVRPEEDLIRTSYPRCYFRCTYHHSQGCKATRQVQRTDNDPERFHITYQSKHTCNQCTVPLPQPG
ncbi:hypothetical protein ACQ4PT_066527 [Festuca glaucescens]